MLNDNINKEDRTPPKEDKYLENICPQLIECDVRPDGDSLVYTRKKTTNQEDSTVNLIVSKDLKDICSYFSGRYTFSDVAKKIYKSDHIFSFRKLINLSQHIASEGFFTESEKILKAIKLITDPCSEEEGTDPNLTSLVDLARVELDFTKEDVSSSSGDGSSGGKSLGNESLAYKISESPLFKEISLLDIQSLEPYWKARRFRKGLQVIHQGAHSKTMFMLLSGKLSVYKKYENGRNRFITTLKSGDLFGEFGAFFDLPRTANVVATQNSEILVIHIEKLKNDERQKGMNTASDVYASLQNAVIANKSLSQNEIFSQLPQEVLHIFTSISKITHCPQKTTLIEQGQMGETFFILIEGKVGIYKDGVLVNKLGKGDFFGEVALIKNIPCTATIKALDDCMLLSINQRVFHTLLCEHLAIALMVEDEADKRLQTLES